MDIQIFLDCIDREKALSRFISTKLNQSLERHRVHLNRVEVRLRDINANRGGIDKECKIVVHSSLPSPMVITSKHSDAGQAFKDGLKSLMVNLRQHLGRMQSNTGRTRKLVRAVKHVA